MGLTRSSVRIPIPEPTVLDGNSSVPPDPVGVVLFAHASERVQGTPADASVAGELQRRGFATLLLDLLTVTASEGAVAAAHQNVSFDIDLLATRLAGATSWLAGRQAIAHVPVGRDGADAADRGGETTTWDSA